MKRTRRIFSWIAVGMVTLALSAGVEIVSHNTFTHSTLSASSATSSTTPAPVTSSTTGTTRVTYQDDGLTITAGSQGGYNN